MKVTCHDKTPFTNFACPCGFELHVHRSQFENAGEEDGLPATVCKGCGRHLLLPPIASVLALIQDTFKTEGTSPFPLKELLFPTYSQDTYPNGGEITGSTTDA